VKTNGLLFKAVTGFKWETATIMLVRAITKIVEATHHGVMMPTTKLMAMLPGIMSCSLKLENNKSNLMAITSHSKQEEAQVTSLTDLKHAKRVIE
jgi:hypothetical protein